MRNASPELLPPGALGLPQKTYDVLLKLADDLQAGTFAHATVAYIDDIDRRGHAGKGLKLFNMSIWHHEIDDCGSVCCIAGWAEVYLGGRQFICRAGPSARDDSHNHLLDSPLFDNVTPEAADALFNLCYPDEVPDQPDPDDYDCITPEMAARCIRHYLATGKVDWQSVYATCREFSSVNDAQASSPSKDDGPNAPSGKVTAIARTRTPVLSAPRLARINTRSIAGYTQRHHAMLIADITSHAAAIAGNISHPR